MSYYCIICHSEVEDSHAHEAKTHTERHWRVDKERYMSDLKDWCDGISTRQFRPYPYEYRKYYLEAVIDDFV